MLNSVDLQANSRGTPVSVINVIQLLPNAQFHMYIVLNLCAQLCAQPVRLTFGAQPVRLTFGAQPVRLTCGTQLEEQISKTETIMPKIYTQLCRQIRVT